MIASEGIALSKWDDTTAPSLYEFDTIIAFPPENIKEGAKLIPELLQAREAGSTVVFLLDMATDPDFFQSNLGFTLTPLRQGISGCACTISDARWKAYFSQGIRAFFLLRGSQAHMALAYLRAPSMVIAAIDPPLKEKGPLLVLPPPGEVTQESLDILLETCNRITRDASPAQGALKDLKQGLILLLFVTLFIIAARFGQRSVNRAHIDNGKENWIAYGNSAFGEEDEGDDADAPILLRTLDGISSADLAQMLGTGDEDALGDEVCASLRLQSGLGLYEREKFIFARALKPDTSPEERNGIIECGESYLLDSARAFLLVGFPEHARFRAQLYLNLLGAVPPGPYLEGSSRSSNLAYSILDLASGNNFPYGQGEAFSKMAIWATDSYGAEEISLQHASELEDSMVDNALYHNLALRENSANRDEAIAAWLDFANRFPQSEKSEEALFNALRLKMNAYRDLLERSGEYAINHPADLWLIEELRPNLVSDNEEAARLADEFVARYPRSHLADDALFYRMRVAFTLGDQHGAWESFRRLMGTYSRSDTARRVQYELDAFLAQAGQLGASGPQIRELVVTCALWNGMTGSLVEHPAVGTEGYSRLLAGARLIGRDTDGMQPPLLCQTYVTSWLQWRAMPR